MQATNHFPSVSSTVLVQHRPVRDVSRTLLGLRSRILSLNPAGGTTRRVRGCLGVERQEQFLGTPLGKILGGGRGRQGASSSEVRYCTLLQ